MKLRTKILLGYGAVLLLLGGVLVLAYFDLRQLGRASDAILSENYRSIQAAEHMINALERQDSGVLRYLLGDGGAGARQFQENQGRFREWLARAKDNVTIEGEARILAEIDSAHTRYVGFFTGLLREGTEANDPPEVYGSRLQPAFAAVRDAAERLRLMNEETMFRASDRARSISRRSTLSVAGVGLVVVAAVLVFSIFLSRRLVRPCRAQRWATGRTRRRSGAWERRTPTRSSSAPATTSRRAP